MSTSIPNAQEAAQSFIQMAVRYQAAGKTIQAIANYQRALEFQPDCVEAMLQLGFICQQQSKFDEALAFYDRVIRQKPDLATAYFLAANIHQRRGQDAQAIPMLLQGAKLEPQAIPAQLHVDLGRYLAAQGQVEEASESCRRALSLDPKLGSAHELLAELFRRQGKFDESLRSLSLLIEDNPALGQFSNSEHVDYSRLSRSWELIKQWDDLQEALDNCLNPSSTTPASARNLWHAGNGFARLGKLDLAIENYQAATQCAPDFGEAFYNLGLVLSNLGTSPWQPPRLQKAVECFQKATQIRRDWADAHFRLGNALEKLLVTGCENQSSDLSPAKTCFQQAVAQKPEHAASCRELGALEGRSGRLLESWGWFKQYYRIVTQRSASHPLGKMGVRFLDPSNAYAIGHLSQNPECYLKLQQLGWLPRFQTIFLAPPGRVANPCLLEYWRKHLEVVTDLRRIQELLSLARTLSHPAFFVELPDGRGMHISPAMSVVQTEWEARGFGPLLSLSEADYERGWKCLEQLGVPKGAWFVSLHVREGGFKREGNSPYNRHRNSDVETYLKAVETITARGGWVIRMGEPSMKPLPARPQLVDYAHSRLKSDWMEVFLCSQCRFFLCSSGGVFTTPQLFGVPVVGTNWPPAIPSHRSQDIIIPKLIRSSREQRTLSFQEALSPPIIHNADGIFLSRLGLEFIENSPEEINELTVEMLDRLSGTVQYTPEEEERQKRIAGFVAPEFGVLTSRIGRDFLNRHLELLR